MTSANHLFILDPRWNPAAVAQAIDRAYRIGRPRPGFGFRLIAKDTIKEKILQLQPAEKQWVDSMVPANSSLIR